jgi:hypothetical protein
MSYWFYEKSEVKCELCRQESPYLGGRLCEVCEEAIVRLMHLAKPADEIAGLPQMAAARAV